MQAADLPRGQRYLTEPTPQRELWVVPDFLCKRTHRVGECQRGAIVARLEAPLETACRRIKFPTGNLDEIECALFSRERFNAASARNARTPGERRQVTASNYSYLDPVVRLTTGSAQIAV